MKIGELSERTGIPTRMLRYYEEQGLLTSERSANGYRSYDETDVERATRARGLVQAGLTTRLAKVVLDVERQCAMASPDVLPGAGRDARDRARRPRRAPRVPHEEPRRRRGVPRAHSPTATCRAAGAA